MCSRRRARGRRPQTRFPAALPPDRARAGLRAAPLVPRIPELDRHPVFSHDLKILLKCSKILSRAHVWPRPARWAASDLRSRLWHSNFLNKAIARARVTLKLIKPRYEHQGDGEALRAFDVQRATRLIIRPRRLERQRPRVMMIFTFVDAARLRHGVRAQHGLGHIPCPISPVPLNPPLLCFASSVLPRILTAVARGWKNAHTNSRTHGCRFKGSGSRRGADRCLHPSAAHRSRALNYYWLLPAAWLERARALLFALAILECQCCECVCARRGVCKYCVAAGFLSLAARGPSLSP